MITKFPSTHPSRSMALLLVLSYFISPLLSANTDPYSHCLQDAFKDANDSMTVAQIKASCAHLKQAKDVDSVVKERIKQDEANKLQPFTIISHRPNYLLLAAYNKKGYDNQNFTSTATGEEVQVDDTEAQFQLSLKVPMGGFELSNKKVDLYGAYTVRSFWQVYNDEESSPFRETNHEPEVWMQTYPNWEFFGFRTSVLQFGLNHQSNGRNEPISRSWNRVFANIVFEKENFVLGFKPWYRLSEDSDDDDNPDITDFMGHFEIRGIYKHKDHVFSLMSRNNLESGFDEGAIEAGWSFPLWNWPYLKGYIQYFRGYGESLIDYDNKVDRIGIGVSLTDFL